MNRARSATSSIRGFDDSDDSTIRKRSTELNIEMRTAEEKLKFKQELEERTIRFAVSTFRCLDALPKAVSSKVIAFQLGKSASSVGANYHEANRGSSPADFASKIAIVLKECAESQYWLRILLMLRPGSETIARLLAECEELLKIFQTVDRRLHAAKFSRARSATSAIRRFDDSDDSTISNGETADR